MNTIATIATIATILSAPIPTATPDYRVATGHLTGYNRGDCLIVTDDGHLWGVRDDLPMEGKVVVTFVTNGTSNVTDDEIISVVLAD